MQLGQRIGKNVLYKYFEAFGLFDTIGSSIAKSYPGTFHDINEIVPVVPYIFPPGSGEIKGRKHGYMGNTSDVGNFLKPLKPMTGGNHSFTREEYESCACNIDGTMANLDFKTGGSSGIINGHARIYGDDKEIFDERYIGERCEPWVLNRKFFEGEGTIVIGAAVKHRNPFVQIFTFFGDEGYNYTDDSMSEITMFSAFDPVNKSKATFDKCSNSL